MTVVSVEGVGKQTQTLRIKKKKKQHISVALQLAEDVPINMIMINTTVKREII